MLTCAPILRPCSAEKLLVTTRTSATVSTFGVTSARPPREIELMFESSSVKEFPSGRMPFALNCGVASLPRSSLPRLRPLTPGCKAIRLTMFRFGMGSSFNWALVIRAEMRPCSVSSASTWAPTFTVSARPLTFIPKSTFRISLAASSTETCSAALKPSFVALTEYVPAPRLSTRKIPRSDVRTSRVTPVATFVTIT